MFRLFRLKMVLCTALILCAGPALALDADSVKKYCDDVKTAAQTAMKKDIALRSPSKSPSNLFEDSVKSCMESISNMGVGFKIPGIGDITSILEQLAKKLLDKACQAAKDQFDSAVQEAENKVNEPLGDINQVPGINTGVDVDHSGGISVGDGGSAAGVIENEGNSQVNGVNFN